jgi:hypothetical protein
MVKVCTRLPKYLLLLALLSLSSACSNTHHMEPGHNQVASLTENEVIDPGHVLYTGTYVLERDDGSSCVLKVVHHLSKTPAEQISFELFCIRGIPSYNSGYALDTVLLSENKAVYSPDFPGIEDKCHLLLEFQETTVEVTQIGNPPNCGFGHAVYANGSYEMVGSEAPTLGCMRMDDPCGTISGDAG